MPIRRTKIASRNEIPLLAASVFYSLFYKVYNDETYYRKKNPKVYVALASYILDDSIYKTPLKYKRYEKTFHKPYQHCKLMVFYHIYYIYC